MDKCAWAGTRPAPTVVRSGSTRQRTTVGARGGGVEWRGLVLAHPLPSADLSLRIFLRQRLIKVDLEVNLFDGDTKVHTCQQNLLPRSIAHTIPRAALLLAAPEDLDMRRELIDEHDFLDRGTRLVRLELIRIVIFLSRWRKHFHYNAWRANDFVAAPPVSNIA